MKMYVLQVKEPKDTEWGTLNRSQLFDKEKAEKELTVLLNRWHQTYYRDASFRIIQPKVRYHL